MSASTEKKNRSAARQAGTDKKTLAAQEEAKKQAVSKRRWTWGTVGVVLLIAAILLMNSGLIYTATTALTANGVRYTPAQANYYYGSELQNVIYQQNYYDQMLGMTQSMNLDTSMGLSGLDNQIYQDDMTWRDYLREAAKDDIRQERALLDYAAENNITLTDDEIAEIDAQMESLESNVLASNFKNLNQYFSLNYGNGVTAKVARQAALDGTLAQKVYTKKQDSLTWTDAELEEHYKSLNGSSDLFDYDYYEVSAKTVESPVTAEDGTESVEMTATDESRQAAKATADAIAAAYQNGGLKEAAAEEPAQESAAPAAGSSDFRAVFAAAVGLETGEADSQPVNRSGVSGSSLPAAYADWLKDAARKAGDVAVFPSSDENPDSYTAVLFVSRDDNHYKTANVRHILIKAEAGEDGTYSDEAKAAAKARAEEILAEYEAGEKTEESFAALANEYSEDTGSNTNGGLYENVSRGRMVEEFEAFCFAGHQPGDTGIVYGESSSYAGYHVMYYVGDGELYSNSLARADLQSEAMSSWNTELTEACTVKEGFGYRFIGK